MWLERQVMLTLHEHLITLLFCKGVRGFQAFVPFVLVLSFSSFQICLVFLDYALLNAHIGILSYSTLDFINIWHRNCDTKRMMIWASLIKMTKLWPRVFLFVSLILHKNIIRMYYSINKINVKVVFFVNLQFPTFNLKCDDQYSQNNLSKVCSLKC